jgi:type I restriction enzyme, S subunit
VSAPMVALGDVVEVKGGGTPSKANSAFWNGDIPWVSPKDMKFWDIEDAEDKITSEAIKGSATNLIPRNAILIVNRSGILKHTLPVGIARRPVAINQDLKALICGPRSHPEYIARLVKAAEPIILKWVRATTADNFPIENLRSLEVPLPSLDEQRRIAAILDKADALRRKRIHAHDLLDSLTQSIFLTTFEDEIGDQHSKAFRTISDVSALQNGAYFPADRYSRTREGVEMVHMSDAFYGMLKRGELKRVNCSPSDIERYQLLDTDLIVARRSLNIEGAAKPCLIPKSQEPLIFESSFIRLRLDPTLVRATYMFHYLSNRFVRDVYLKPYITQSTISGINQSNFGKVRVLVPSLSRQDKFISVAREIDEKRIGMKMSLQQHDNLFASLQSLAFSGQL